MIVGPALLFCPADRPDRFGKAALAGDSVILDLEDAVAPQSKAAAREAVVASRLDPLTTLVRVNPRASGLLGDDLAALADTQYRTLLLPKAEAAADLEPLAGFSVVAICETPLGVRNADLLADLPEVVALTWGAEDLVAGLGGTSSRGAGGRYRDVARYARSRVLVAAASAGKAAYDTVHLAIPDEAGLRESALDAAASGFDGALCIHPRQVPVIRSAFLPPPELVEWATALLAAAQASPGGVFTFRGRMIDEPLLRHARRIVAVG